MCVCACAYSKLECVLRVTGPQYAVVPTSELQAETVFFYARCGSWSRSAAHLDQCHLHTTWGAAVSAPTVDS